MNLARIDEGYRLRDERLGFIPENFKKESITDATASEMNPIARFLESSIVKLPMWVFSASGIVLKARKPVSVKVLRGETLFFAENETLDVYATGESLEEAIKAFTDHVIYFYTHYKGLDWNRVIGEAKRLKKLYETLFEEINS